MWLQFTLFTQSVEAIISQRKFWCNWFKFLLPDEVQKTRHSLVKLKMIKAFYVYVDC